MAKTLPKITLDVSPLFDTTWTGIPIFTRRLAAALLNEPGIEVEFCYQLTKVPTALVVAAIRSGTGAFLADHFESHVGRGDDSYGAVDPASCLLFPSVKGAFDFASREASTIHDLGTLFMPENCEDVTVTHHLQNLSQELASNEITFCVSEATKAALSTAFPSVSSRARVIYQYVDWPAEFEVMDMNLEFPNLGKYVVVVGTVEPRKNLGLILRALNSPEMRRSPYKVVVIGKKGWKVDAFMAELSEEDRKRMVFTGFVSEFVKYRLIKHAAFMVFPSVYEGFGIPAVEAMSLGKPVLAAMSSSLPEVVGRAGLYFDPLSVSDFISAFSEMASEGAQKKMAAHAASGAAQFSAKRMAQPVVQWSLSQ